MQKFLKPVVLFLGFIVVFFSSTLLAKHYSSPVGYWKTYDGVSPKPISIVKVYEHEGELRGRIILVNYHKGGNQPYKCTACVGKYHNKPTKNLVVMWGLRKDSDFWRGGKILDPMQGAVYQCSIALGHHGKELTVRAFMGMALLGRTMSWKRVDEKHVERIITKREEEIAASGGDNQIQDASQQNKETNNASNVSTEKQTTQESTVEVQGLSTQAQPTTDQQP